MTFVAKYTISFYCYITFSISKASVKIDGTTYSDGSKLRIDLSNDNNKTDVDYADNPNSTFIKMVNISYDRTLNRSWKSNTGGGYSKKGSDEGNVSITFLGNSTLTVKSGYL